MAKTDDKKDLQQLPSIAADYIKSIINRMKYRRRVRLDVQEELASHFEDEIKDISDKKERDRRIEKLIEEFGDVKQLAILLRRAKKRCRPLWAKAIVRSLQCVGLLLLMLVVYTFWFVSGEPHARVDYLVRINQMSRPEVLTQDNAWPHYEKAAQMLIEPSEQLQKSMREARGNFRNLDVSEQYLVEKWINENTEAWREFVEGSSRQYCYREYEFRPSHAPHDRFLMNVSIPHLSDIKTLGRLGIWRARRAMQGGKVEKAIEDCLAVARTAGHWQGHRWIVEQLVARAIESAAEWQITDFVASGKMSSEQLNSLQQEVSKIHADGFPLMDMEFDRLLFLDVVQNVFTDSGPGGGHLVPGLWPGLTDAADYLVKPNIRNFVNYILDDEKPIMVPLYTAASIVHARRDDTVARYNKIFEDAVRIMRMTPYSVHTQQLDIEQKLSKLPQYRYFLIHAMMPPTARLGAISFRGKATYEATQMILALERCYLDKGDYPTSAEELISDGYLCKLPLDPFSDKPLVYKKIEDGYTLYSVGPDFKDDGGKSSVDKNGQTHKWWGDGDTVFWPIDPPVIPKKISPTE